MDTGKYELSDEHMANLEKDRAALNRRSEELFDSSSRTDRRALRENLDDHWRNYTAMVAVAQLHADLQRNKILEELLITIKTLADGRPRGLI